MNDPCFDIVVIRSAASDLRELFAPMAMTPERAAKINEVLSRLRSSTDNIARWMDENPVL